MRLTLAVFWLQDHYSGSSMLDNLANISEANSSDLSNMVSDLSVCELVCKLAAIRPRGGSRRAFENLQSVFI